MKIQKIKSCEEIIFEDNQIHFKMERNIRKFIKKNGGTMPEKVPTPNKSLKKLEKERFISKS